MKNMNVKIYLSYFINLKFLYSKEREREIENAK